MLDQDFVAPTRDPFRIQVWVVQLVSSIEEISEVGFFDYDGTGPLFTDPSLATEYEPEKRGESMEACGEVLQAARLGEKQFPR